MLADMSDGSDSDADSILDPEILTVRRLAFRAVRHGIQLSHCKHVFCGVRSTVFYARFTYQFSYIQSCLAQAIYRNLGVGFNPETYGTKFTPTESTGQLPRFPMGCPVGVSVSVLDCASDAMFLSYNRGSESPLHIYNKPLQTCETNPGEAIVEIGDTTAQLVLGDKNMDEWNHARWATSGCGRAL